MSATEGGVGHNVPSGNGRTARPSVAFPAYGRMQEVPAMTRYDGGSDPDEGRILSFLADARGAGVIGKGTERSLVRFLQHQARISTAMPEPARVTAAKAGPTTATLPPPPVGVREKPSLPRLQVQPPPPSGPAPWRAWLGRLKAMVASDVTLHGFAYLGVLLMFTGVFGFVVFAFGELDPAWRPVAEAAIPTVFFVSAWFLRRQRAPHIASAMQLLGGLTLPIVAYASFVDNGTVPADLMGTSLVIALTAVSLAVAAVYLIWWRRHADTPLRYLIVPMVWMAVWAAGIALGDTIVEGFEIRQPNPGQMALFTLAVTVSAAIARRAGDRPLANETLVAAIPGVVLGFGLTMASGLRYDWPVWPAALAGAAAVAGIECLSLGVTPARTSAVRLTQTLVAALSLLAMAQTLEPAQAGAIGIPVAIAFYEWWRRSEVRAPEGVALGVAAAAALAVSMQVDLAMLGAWAAAGLWLLVRQHTATSYEAVWMRTAAATVPLGAAVALFRVTDADVALFVIAVVIAAASVGFRVIGRSDFETAWLIVAAASTAAAAPFLAAVSETTSELGGASVLAAGVLATAPRTARVRVWIAGPAAVASLVLWMRVFGVAEELRPALVALAGIAVAVAATAIRRPVACHLEAAGYAVGAAGLLALWTVGEGPLAPIPLVPLAAWTAAWLWSAALAERGRDPLAAGLASYPLTEGPGPWVPAVVAAASLPLVLLDAGRLAGWIDDRVPAGLTLAGLALIEAGATRVLRRFERPARVVADSAVLLALAALWLAWIEPWPAVIVCGALILGVLALAPSTRRPVDVWLAWAASAGMAFGLARIAGVGDDRLFAVGIGWGVAAVVGGLAADDALRGRRTAGEFVRTPWLVPAAMLGVLGVGVGVGAGFEQPIEVHAPWLIGVGGACLVAAWQLRLGAVSMLAWLSAGVGVAELARQTLERDPWTAVVAAIVPAVIGVALYRGEPGDLAVERRWSLPALTAAHLATIGGLALAVAEGEIAPTWLAAAALSLSFAAALRHPAWLIAAVALALVGTYDLGPTWFAIALGVSATGSWLAATKATGQLRRVLQGVGVVFWAAAWVTTVEAAGWGDTEALRATAVVGALIALAAAGVVRARWVAVDWLLPAAVMAASAVVRSAVGLHLAGPSVEDAWVLAAALGGSAIALALAARPAALDHLRDAAALVFLGAGAEVLVGLDPTISVATGVAVATGLASLAVALSLWRASRLTWVRAFAVAGVVAAGSAVTLALQVWPTRAPLVAALLALAAEALVAGLLVRQAQLLAAAPVLACAAWLVFASAALTGEPMWFTVPSGVAVLSVLEVVRWDRRQRSQPPASPELVAVELLALAVILGVAPIQVVLGEPWAGVTGIGLGVAIAAWGVETRVRRRLWAGAGAVALCLVLLAVLPLVRNVPEIGGSALWLVLAGLGAMVVVAATTIERARPRLQSALHHLHERLEGWE